MYEPASQLQEAASRESLWEKAPAWRNLTITASLLTLAAFALPMAVPQTPDREAKPPSVASVQPMRASVSAALPPAAPLAPKPSNAAAPAPPSAAAPALRMARPVPQRQIPAPISPRVQTASLPPQEAPAAPQPQAVATLAPHAQPDEATNACQLTWPTSSTPGFGTILSFYDRATALRMIQVTEAQTRGKIDPDYADNQRVDVLLPDGRHLVALVLKTLTVHAGDRVTFQGGYRNTKLPCNYIPSLITADTGPAPPSNTAAPPAQMPPQN